MLNVGSWKPRSGKQLRENRGIYILFASRTKSIFILYDRTVGCVAVADNGSKIQLYCIFDYPAVHCERNKFNHKHTKFDKHVRWIHIGPLVCIV